METEEKSCPNIPAIPEEIAKREKGEGEKEGGKAVKAGIDGAENVAAIELSCREEVKCRGEKTDPGGAAYWGKQEEVRIDAGMKQGIEKAEKQGNAEDDGVLGRIEISDCGNDIGMKYAVDKGGNGKDKTDQRAGGADIEEGAGSANGRAHEDKGAKGADERGEGNEEGVAGVNVMVAASEEMAEFVGEKNGQESGREGETGEKTCGIFVEESEGAEKIVERHGLIVSIGGSELSTCGEAGAKRQEKERYGEDKRPEGRAGENRNVKLCGGRKSAPIHVRRKPIQGGI